jgi:NitT/TauT family transport system ATP-binding protein
MSGPGISIRGLARSFEGLAVLSGLDLEVPSQGVTAVLGPSGCGKTTLLRILAGLIPADAGVIEGVAPQEVTLLFQQPRLLPWETVRANVEFVLPPAWPAGERAAAVESVLADVQMGEFSAYYPAELSGGMAQRVDLSLRLVLIGVLGRLLEAHPRTSIFVTHSVREALLVGEEIALLSARPARVVEVTRNGLPPEERRLDSEAFLHLERQLYGRIRESAG